MNATLLSWTFTAIELHQMGLIKDFHLQPQRAPVYVGSLCVQLQFPETKLKQTLT